ncbi:MULTISPECIES: lytic transglycosylase [Legionella]|uniref:lytic transglycosylase n=1 Tax=Legionella TaxID=445 RepID=UPI000F8EFC98|nr:LysM peptidoglycan-binding domain-containing protein [Legionella sp. 27cVA30]RUR09089.1 LysM peptidoglycan-binding domain-containing protein [Legionella septentrionalis]RUR14150.1 LysM peptidoglycan-binding domain-containing protein [Legionella septentrionalis]
MKFKPLIISYLCLVLAFFSPVSTAVADSSPSVWDVLRRQFTLNHEVTRPEVQNQLRWLISHPSYLQKLAQSEPYIYHIITEIKKRNLPGEIALIPMIESAYDPFAYSGAGAAGLWQLMPGTGTDLGLKRDWWFDARRSIGHSTDAALNYLSRLNKFFNGNWLLAFAAYDSGEGTVARCIKKSNQSRRIDFWALPVPQETRAYIPRLLALAEVIQNPQRYHVQLPDIPHVPYFEEVNIGSQIDLDHAAKLAGISYHDLIKLNPGYNRWATAPYRPYKLLIPADKVEDFSRNLANLPESKRVSWARHQVSAGDNLVLIAKKYHTSVNLIKELNQLKSNAVKKGQVVLVPNSKQTPPAAINPPVPAKAPVQHFTAAKQLKVIHIVQARDSLQQIGNRYGVAPSQIRQWNRLNLKSGLRRGQQLVIWKPSRPTGVYMIKKGDNLSTIAKSQHTTVRTLLQLNPHLQKNVLRPGQKIRLG